MPSNFEATHDLITSLADINTLIEYATKERDQLNEENRMLFLKLAIVSLVTKFQVFIESILKEYLYCLRMSSKPYGQISIHLRLNAIRLFTSNNIVHKALENPEVYNNDKLQKIKTIAAQTLKLCEDTQIVNQDLLFETKFPLGKTGTLELSKLFRQVRGEDIFENSPFDINKLNEILGRRHAIIHEDSNPQITEQVVELYKDYLFNIINYIDNYLGQNK